jgi:hypothetical protein
MCCRSSFKKRAADIAATVEKIGQARSRNSRINDCGLLVSSRLSFRAKSRNLLLFPAARLARGKRCLGCARHDKPAFHKLKQPGVKRQRAKRIQNAVFRNWRSTTHKTGAKLVRTSGSLELDQAATIGRSDGLGPAHHVQLAENASHVRLHCGFADEEIRPDLFVASAAGEQLKHIDFSVG